MKEEIKFNLKVDDIIVSLIKDYHDIEPLEVINHFYDLMREMVAQPGNIKNESTTTVRCGGYKVKNKWTSAYKKVPTEKVKGRYDDSVTDGYALRGFYPGTKVPFKMTGVKTSGDRHTPKFAFFVVALGNKSLQVNINESKLNKISEIIAESVILDEDIASISEDLYKVKDFKCMTPKGIKKHGKSK